MNVVYWNRQGSFEAEVDYVTPADFVRAFIEMCDTLRGGGHCLLTIKGRSQLLTNLSQLLPLEAK